MNRQNHGRRPFFDDLREGFRLDGEDELDFFMTGL